MHGQLFRAGLTLLGDGHVGGLSSHRVDHDRARLVLDLDGVDTVLRGGFGFGQHRDHRLANVDNAVESHDDLTGEDCAFGVNQGQVVDGQHGDHARDSQCRLFIN